MRDWKFKIDEYAIINPYAKKHLPDDVGKLVQIYELKTKGLHDYTVKLSNGDYVFVNEDELNKIDKEELKIYQDFFDGRFNVFHKPSNKVVIMVEVDLLNKQIEILHNDESMEVVGVYSLMQIQNEAQRISWDEYFMEIAEQVSTRATCDRLHVGCVIVKDKRIVSTGYNGSPSGESHCDEIGHLYNDQNRCVRTIHAEQNAILFANRNDLLCATAYVTHQPCENCAKLLVQSGIKRVVYKEKYTNTYSDYFLNMIESVHLGGKNEDNFSW